MYQPVAGKTIWATPQKRNERMPVKDGELSKRPKPNYPCLPREPISMSDIAGMEDFINDLWKLIKGPLTYPEIYLHIGAQPPRGVLAYGPPGGGKNHSGERYWQRIWARIADLFKKAREKAPCLIFIDDIHAITPQRDNPEWEVERRLVTQVVTYMEGLTMETTGGKPVMVIGATDQPDSLGPALRKAGIFDRNLILRVVCQKMRLPGDFDYQQLAKKKNRGYVGGGLRALATAAAGGAIKRLYTTAQIPPVARESSEVAAIVQLRNSASMNVDQAVSRLSLPQQITPGSGSQYPDLPPFKAYRDACTEKLLDSLHVTFRDFLTALTKSNVFVREWVLQQCLMSHGQMLGSLKVEMRMAIVVPIKNPDLFTSVGITAPKGALLSMNPQDVSH
ncbi:P-loop containing nucleoside triphosphate hydrolase protein [Tuber brumale]|nr:P-loop containing nucleoside triphosphate hydrolase protein [Tuber brumale]